MFRVQRVVSSGSPGPSRLPHGRSLIAPVPAIGTGNFRLPLSAMRTTIVAYTSGEAAKVKWAGLMAGERQACPKRGRRRPKKLLSSVERENDGLYPKQPFVAICIEPSAPSTDGREVSRAGIGDAAFANSRGQVHRRYDPAAGQQRLAAPGSAIC